MFIGIFGLVFIYGFWVRDGFGNLYRGRCLLKFLLEKVGE